MEEFRKFVAYYDILCQKYRGDFPHWQDWMSINTMENFASVLNSGVYYLKQFYVDVDEIQERGLTATEFEVPLEFLAAANPKAYEVSQTV